MPFYKKGNKTPANGKRRKTGSSVINSFKRYNTPNVTSQGIKNFLIYNFYKVGYNIDAACKMTAKAVEKTVLIPIEKFLQNVLDFMDNLAGVLLDDLGEPLGIANTAISKATDIFKTTKNDKSVNTFGEIKSYFKDGLSRHNKSAEIILSYTMPILTCRLFLLVMNSGLSKNYAIQVYSGGENLGTVANYNIVKNANNIIQNKIVSTNDEKWTFNSDIKMVSVKSDDETISERQLANNMLSASSRDIVEATGLYVDGKFVAAVKDPTKLNRALDSLKAPYENGDENRTVSFVQDVSLVYGIYFTGTIVPDDQLATTVVSEVSGQQVYTVVQGDSPSKIASEHGLTLNQLYSLNPGLEGGGMWIGDQLIISASVPFLQVKYTERVTRQVEIPFRSKTEDNNSLTFGVRKVTQQGQNGIKEEVVDVEYIDGVYQGETVIQSTVIKEAVDQITQVGRLYKGTVVATSGTGSLMWPVPGYKGLSRGFAGQYPAHNGLDIRANVGTPIYAADSGVVTTAVYTNRGYGVYVIIEHGGYQTLYGHCSSLAVSRGQSVSKGQLIAYVGSTGNSTGPHCHFEVKNGNFRYNPFNYL